jgi:hypothetical protein
MFVPAFVIDEPCRHKRQFVLTDWKSRFVQVRSKVRLLFLATYCDTFYVFWALCPSCVQPDSSQVPDGPCSPFKSGSNPGGIAFGAQTHHSASVVIGFELLQVEHTPRCCPVRALSLRPQFPSQKASTRPLPCCHRVGLEPHGSSMLHEPAWDQKLTFQAITGN